MGGIHDLRRRLPMARLRRQNGRDKAWKVKYLGVGNESWGCGGSMRPEYYADLYRRYSTYCRNYDGNSLFKIASGASDYDYNWTKVLMDRVGGRMHGLSLALLHRQPAGAAVKAPPPKFEQRRLLLDTGQMPRNRRCHQEALHHYG